MRWYYNDTIENFLSESESSVIGHIFNSAGIAPELTERYAWQKQITLLQAQLGSFTGKIFFEFSIPRMGKRVDVVLALGSVVIILEFKVGESQFRASAIDQVWDYALDLKNFHETSHDLPIVVVNKIRTVV